MNYLVAMAVGAGVAEIATLPVCTTKTVVQINPEFTIARAVNYIWKQRGLRGFYAASLPAICNQVFSSTSKYTLYRVLRNNVPQEHLSPHAHRTICSLLGGLMVSLVTHPLEFTKVRWQANLPVIPLLKGEGARAFYRGFSGTFYKSSLGAIIYFPLNDLLREQLKSSLLASFFTAVIGVLITHPFDLLRVKRVVGQSLKLRELYRGVGLNLLRVVPHFIIAINIAQYLA